MANAIGMDRIEARHRELADYMLAEMTETRRGVMDLTRPEALRCAIVTVNVPPIQRMKLEDWMWKTQKDSHPWWRTLEATSVYALLHEEGHTGVS